jgi:hypothetical protein
MTRWLSTADAVRVVLRYRDVYIIFFMQEETDKAFEILEVLEDSKVMGWYTCLQEVLPAVTTINVLFQSTLPLPHLLYGKITGLKAILMKLTQTPNLERMQINSSTITAAKLISENMVDTGGA